MWVSIAYRPQTSNYTRCQRVSCTLTFIMLSLIANAMFFRAEGKDGDIEYGAGIQIGPFRFSLKQVFTVYTSFISALIVTPPTILLIYLFKLSKPKPVDPKTTLFKPGERSTKIRVPMVHDWLEKQHQRSVQLEKCLVQKGYPSTQGLKLPYQCTYLAWFLVFLIWFLCAFFIMLYSMEWGKKKSEEWLTSFFLSCFESIFCLDPVKVLLMTLVFTIVFRSNSDSKAIIDRSTIIKKYSKSLRGRSGGMRLAAPPLAKGHLKKAKRLRQKELQMNRAIRDTILNLLMCWIIFSIAYSNRDGRSYLIYKETMDAFIAPPNKNYPPPHQTEHELPKFTEIKKQHDYFEWLNKTVLPRMFPEVDINNETLHWRLQQFIEGGTKYRVGPPRLRQLRIKSDRCKNEYMDETKCYKNYNEPDEETGAFCIGWKAGPCDDKESVYNFSSAAWNFTSAFDIWGITIDGGYNIYGGGGYIAKLDVNMLVSQKIVNELYLNSWIDRHTRAVALEFTLYCLQENIFTYNMFLVEFPETGGAFVYYGIHPMNVYQHVGPMGLYTLACELIYIVYLVGFTVMLIVMIVQQKKAFFSDTWQVYDLVFVILGYVAIAMYLVRHVMTSQTMSVFKEDKKAFINFYHIALWNEMLVLLLGILCFMATLRLLNVLGYNKRIGTVVRVFKKAGSQLIWFSLFFTACFTIYCILGWLLFGAHLEYYKDIYTSLRTMFLSMIGKNRFTEMDNTCPYMAKIYFLLFIGFVVYLVLTMFLALLSKAIDDVHDEAKKDTGDEMVDFVLNKLKRLILVGKSVKHLVKDDESKHPAPRSNNARIVYTYRGALEEIRNALQCALISDPRGK
ncbi:polycystic kidney disease 2-like 1 protein [Dreissena polymorpha]|uniref:polycystic kidney disease 2-like 1 protein n=1 Tax=Dreissena polymorpha TaxID=45954 RepID=UPI0022656D2F|nr:polycystic kidney disease 2-like 1 protein [Dreissena polymorpha]